MIRKLIEGFFIWFALSYSVKTQVFVWFAHYCTEIKFQSLVSKTIS